MVFFRQEGKTQTAVRYSALKAVLSGRCKALARRDLSPSESTQPIVGVRFETAVRGGDKSCSPIAAATRVIKNDKKVG